MASFVAVSAPFTAASSGGTATYPAGVEDGDLILIHATTATSGTLVIEWPLNRPGGGLTEVDTYSINLYLNNKTAAQLVDDLEIVTAMAIRDNKTVAVPEWGIYYTAVTAAGALTALQTMCDAFRAVGDRLAFQQYFEDQATWMLHRTSNWGGQNLLDNYGAMVLDDPP